MSLQVAFRTDASNALGIGHVMRCLTLADSLQEYGLKCHFISSEMIGDLAELIAIRGHQLTINQLKPHRIPRSKLFGDKSNNYEWAADSENTIEILKQINPDWLVVDNYTLDKQWEKSVARYVDKILIIDDLANRPHHCDILVDPNFGRVPKHYNELVDRQCKVLCGPHYALIRSAFRTFRKQSLQRRQDQRELKKLFVSMGGVDQNNATERVLNSLRQSSLPSCSSISVVMGSNAPWIENVRLTAKDMPWPTQVFVAPVNIAELMAESDLAIGAAGGTSWERCCVGLPTLLVVLAENQLFGANAMDTANIAKLIGQLKDISITLPKAISDMNNINYRRTISMNASNVTDGKGASRILSAMGVQNA